MPLQKSGRKWQGAYLHDKDGHIDGHALVKIQTPEERERAEANMTTIQRHFAHPPDPERQKAWQEELKQAGLDGPLWPDQQEFAKKMKEIFRPPSEGQTLEESEE